MSSSITPLVSVILPTFNRAAFLKRSAGSVLAQDFEDLELIVVDDASTQDVAGTVQMLRDTRVRYVRRPANGGVAAARNTGVQAAKGRYLAFQDSDDEWLLDKLSRQVADLQPLDELSMSVCGLLRPARRKLDGAQPPLLTYPRSLRDWRHGLDRRAVLIARIAYVQTWLVPRRAVLEAGGFDERLSVWDDWDLLIRLASCLPIRTRTEPLVISERNPDGLASDVSRFVRDLPLILEKNTPELERSDPATLYYLRGVEACMKVHLSTARTALLQALRRNPRHAPSWRLLTRTMLGATHIRRRFGLTQGT
jgi:glycosyltransferase involved in cell wall biosynthesis